MKFKFFLAAMLLAAFGVVFAIAPALADAANTVVAEKKFTIDFTKTVTDLAVLAWLGAATAIVAVYKWASAKFSFVNKLITAQQVQDLTAPLLDEAIAFGVGRLENADWLKIETKNEAVATAVQYALDHGGDILNKLGWGRELLEQKLEARLVAQGYDKKPGQWTDDPPKDGAG